MQLLRDKALRVESPGATVALEVRVESLWLAQTFYPEVLVWRVWFKGCAVIGPAVILLRDQHGVLHGCGARVLKVVRYRPTTAIGQGRAVRLRLASDGDNWFEIALRITDLSAFCAVRQRGNRGFLSDESVTRLPTGAVAIGGGAAVDYIATATPTAFYMPSSKVVAFWSKTDGQHFLFFDTPRAMAAGKFGALAQVDALRVESGSQALHHFFLTLPFTRAPLPAPLFGNRLTKAARAAFALMCAVDGVGEDYQVMRAEPGVFAVVARREGARWRVAGIADRPITLTVRFEELWWRTPQVLRGESYSVIILRDVTAADVAASSNMEADSVAEIFGGQAPDVRVVLDLARDGGFLLTFTTG